MTRPEQPQAYPGDLPPAARPPEPYRHEFRDALDAPLSGQLRLRDILDRSVAVVVENGILTLPASTRGVYRLVGVLRNPAGDFTHVSEVISL